jgi:hypothetical protein
MGYLCNVSKMVAQMRLCEITSPWEKIDIVGEFELDVNVNIDCYHKDVSLKFVGFAAMWQQVPIIIDKVLHCDTSFTCHNWV